MAQKAEAEKKPSEKELAEAAQKTAGAKDVKGAADEKVAAPEGHKLYKLTRRYWDNRVMHKPGAKLYFLEGQAPKGSVLAEE